MTPVKKISYQNEQQIQYIQLEASFTINKVFILLPRSINPTEFLVTKLYRNQMRQKGCSLVYLKRLLVKFGTFDRFA